MVEKLFQSALLLILGVSCTQVEKKPAGGYYAGDFHQHTTYSGGEYTIGHVMQADYKYGLDWWSNSDHGGVRELSGNTFISTGELVTSVDFRIAGVTMGETAELTGDKVKIEIAVLDPETKNFNTFSDYTSPLLDHIDLIAGQVTGKIPPESSDYGKDEVTTTRVIARFDANGGANDANGIESIKWTDAGNGWKKMSFETDLAGDMYFRLRGTNHPLNTPDELDDSGNPLPDIAGENTPAKAFADLWFYSNPIFVKKTK
jgi:hypothetical protein